MKTVDYFNPLAIILFIASKQQKQDSMIVVFSLIVEQNGPWKSDVCHGKGKEILRFNLFSPYNICTFPCNSMQAITAGCPFLK